MSAFDISGMNVSQKFYFGKSKKNLIEVELLAYDFSVDPSDGLIQYSLEFRGLYGHSIRKTADSLFWLMRDVISAARLLIDEAMRMHPGCHLYVDFGGIEKVSELSELFMFEVPWSMSPPE